MAPSPRHLRQPGISRDGVQLSAWSQRELRRRRVIAAYRRRVSGRRGPAGPLAH